MRLYKQPNTDGKRYVIVFFMGAEGQLTTKFNMSGPELDHVLKLISRPRWFRPWNFGVQTNDGNTRTYVDLRKVIVAEANEEQYMIKRKTEEAEIQRIASMPPGMANAMPVPPPEPQKNSK